MCGTRVSVCTDVWTDDQAANTCGDTSRDILIQCRSRPASLVGLVRSGRGQRVALAQPHHADDAVQQPPVALDRGLRDPPNLGLVAGIERQFVQRRNCSLRRLTDVVLSASDRCSCSDGASVWRMRRAISHVVTSSRSRIKAVTPATIARVCSAATTLASTASACASVQCCGAMRSASVFSSRWMLLPRPISRMA